MYIYAHKSWKLISPYNIISIEREDAKITAWENTQKAKAEAAIQKLVVCSLLYF